MTDSRYDEWAEPVTHLLQTHGDLWEVTMPRRAWGKARRIAKEDHRPFESVAYEMALAQSGAMGDARWYHYVAIMAIPFLLMGLILVVGLLGFGR